ncbi:MAG: ABC transporter permease [Sulfolobales archaeon]|nr:ABC transporter permease [Sulfolobales archaeon]MCX8199055.1 ABC transporter permease [Sulfolobales archaeon]MDW8170034.1 ABC transporter permease [Desulfurococcaceae archaeon]
MLKYLVKRFFITIPTLILILLLTFILARSLPGDPITVMYGELQPPPEVREALERELGLDKPIIIQFLLHIYRMMRGDWGRSIHTGIPTFELIKEAFISTLILTMTSILIASSLGLLLSYLSITHYNTRADKVIRVFSIATFSFPVFWWGFILILVFSVYLRLLPAGGKGGIEHLVLPSITLATVNLGMITRVSRAALLEVLMQDHVILAKAKGLDTKAIMLKHVIRNALITIITIIGLRFGVLLGGAVITETVFAYPGMGKVIIDSIFSRDYPILIGGVFVASLAIMVVNIIVDLVYALLDPRVKVGG